jgi:hypothetical protein
MTAHSPVGIDPGKFNVSKVSETTGSFANNDLEHIDSIGGDHERFSYGLKKSLFNYMHGIGLDEPLQKWFDFKVPRTTVQPDYIANELYDHDGSLSKPSSKIIWLGKNTGVEYFTQSKKGNSREMATLSFTNKKITMQIKVVRRQGEWLTSMLPKLSVDNKKIYTVQELKADYEATGLEDFELFWDNKPMTGLHKVGLLQL